jgi:large subunit ribosomal protein L35
VRGREVAEWPGRGVTPHYPTSARLAFAGERRYKARLHADIEMPKLKTKSGAKKRFGRTASGKITMNVAHKRHRLISKPKQMKRKARGKVMLQPGDAKLVLTYMPYLRG